MFDHNLGYSTGVINPTNRWCPTSLFTFAHMSGAILIDLCQTDLTLRSISSQFHATLGLILGIWSTLHSNTWLFSLTIFQGISSLFVELIKYQYDFYLHLANLYFSQLVYWGRMFFYLILSFFISLFPPCRRRYPKDLVKAPLIFFLLCFLMDYGTQLDKVVEPQVPLFCNFYLAWTSNITCPWPHLAQCHQRTSHCIYVWATNYHWL